MNRRNLLRGFAAAASGLLLPIGAEGETRTPMRSPSPHFECGASAISPPRHDALVYPERRFWSLDQTMAGSWLHIPRSGGLAQKYSIRVFYPDGGREMHAVDAPQERKLRLRINRTDAVEGVSVQDAETGILLATYGPVIRHLLEERDFS